MLWQPENFHIGEQSLQQDWSCSNGWTDAWNNKIIDGTNVISNVLCHFMTVFLSNEHRDCSPASHYTHMKGGHFVLRFLYLRFPIVFAYWASYLPCRWRDMNGCHFLEGRLTLCGCASLYLSVYVCTVIRRVSERLVMRLGICDFTVAHLSSTHCTLQSAREIRITHSSVYLLCLWYAVKRPYGHPLSYKERRLWAWMELPSLTFTWWRAWPFSDLQARP